MSYRVERTNESFQFRGMTPAGHAVEMDGGVEGVYQAASPMQLLVLAMGGCSGVDILSILEKGKQHVAHFSVVLEPTRVRRSTYSEFTAIHAHFVLEGELDPSKVRRAVKLSIEKYCSVSKLLEKTATITYSFEINGERFEE